MWCFIKAGHKSAKKEQSWQESNQSTTWIHGSQHWTREEKTGIVLSLLRNEHSAAELSRKHGVSQTTISKWKDKFIEAGQAGLGGQKTPSRTREIEVEQLKIALAGAE